MSTEPETVSWLRVAIAFLVVGGLLGLMGYALKHLNLRGIKMPGGTVGKRLSIIENMPLDVRRRLVLVRCDDKEHLLLLGTNQDIVVESDIAAPPQTKTVQ
ncbi:MAG TPA: flagellar biosynthetic protein FliO, partial [Alphaproteobacteria bacterium]|nr:flagellar biosynthetic protein FliO [Alphaproteobacteria bacterium]